MTKKRLIVALIIIGAACFSVVMIVLALGLYPQNASIPVKEISGATSVSDSSEASEKSYIAEERSELINFQSDQLCFMDGEESSVLFTVESKESSEPVFVFENEISIGQMNDDGINGDEQKGDGIYSYSYKKLFSADEGKEISFIAKTGSSQSNTCNLYVFSAPTEEKAENIEQSYLNVTQELKVLEQSYIGTNGYVEDNQRQALTNDIVEYLEKATDDGDVLFYEVEGDSVYIKMVSGISVLYQPKDPETDVIGDEVSVSVITCQPYYTDMVREASDPAFLKWMDEASEDIEETFGNYVFTGNYDDDQVTRDVINSFGPNSVILWHGHGAYYGTLFNGGLIVLGIGQSAFPDTVIHFDDYVKDRCLASVSGNILISSKFIETYCGDLTNTFIYLAACQSGYNSSMARTFLNKGAVAVVANTETIKRTYNVSMLVNIVWYMEQINPDTLNYYTLSEALQLAKDRCGEDDHGYGGVGAAPIIFGGDAALQYRFRDISEENGIPTIKWKGASGEDPEPGVHLLYAIITAYDTAGNIIWSAETDPFRYVTGDDTIRYGEIGICNGLYYFNESYGNIIAYDIYTGQVMWRNSDFEGSTFSKSDCTFDSSGNLTIRGYANIGTYIVIDKNGKTVSINLETGPSVENNDAWKQAYIDFIEENRETDSTVGYKCYKLINIDGDNIPELYCWTGVAMMGDMLCSYANDQLITSFLSSDGLSYIEGQNIFRVSGGRYGLLEDGIWTISDGNFVTVAGGSYNTENSYGVQYDDSGNPICNYYWNGTAVSGKEEYDSLMNSVFNTNEAIRPFEGATYDANVGRYVGNGACDYYEILDMINAY